MRLPTADELIEWAGGAAIAAAIGIATEPKYGAVAFLIYIGLVLVSVSWQLEQQ